MRLPPIVSMPPFTVSSAPSVRIRFTLPLTVMRLLTVTGPETTYQPLPIEVVLAVTS